MASRGSSPHRAATRVSRGISPRRTAPPDRGTEDRKSELAALADRSRHDPRTDACLEPLVEPVAHSDDRGVGLPEKLIELSISGVHCRVRFRYRTVPCPALRGVDWIELTDTGSRQERGPHGGLIRSGQRIDR